MRASPSGPAHRWSFSTTPVTCTATIGRLAQITVNDKYGPGDLVPVLGEVKIAVRVLGPSWVTADRIELYANGHKIREALIPDGKQPGVKWAGTWTLPRVHHDVNLVAIAS